ncbi:hypothetical protein BGZ83_008259 [Gryganskiella cystojenkinii]|nr:hypothetical protein BGZ83_008259 [Gryganskiella cystojenkinii]
MNLYLSNETCKLHILRITVSTEDDEVNDLFYYRRTSLSEICMDTLSYNIARKSHDVQFLPTHWPCDRKLTLNKADVLRDLPEDSDDIMQPDLWMKYLVRPYGTVFDNMTYIEFFKKFHEVWGAHI